MKELINWHELSRILSGNGQNIRPNSIPKKYEKKIYRLLKILEVWERWQNRANGRVLLSGREFEKLLLSNAGQALLAAILLLAAVRYK